MTGKRSALLGAALLILLACLAPGASAAKRTVPQGFYGANWDGAIIDAPPAVQDRQWGQMAASGVESSRAVFYWSQAQREAGAPFDFSKSDQVVEGATRHGIRVLPVVMYAPRWARMEEYKDESASPPANNADYGVYLTALVGRYGVNGSFWREHPDLPRRPLREWQIWNEPQFRFQWSVQPDWQASYGDLLRAAHGALRRADPKAKVVLAAFANNSWERMDEAYRLGGIKGYFDAAAAHPYTRNPLDAFLTMRNVRQLMQRRGDGRKPLWATEMSWPAAEGRVSKPSELQTTEGSMASRLTKAYALLARRRAERDVGVSRVYWYTWSSPYQGDFLFSYGGLNQYNGAGFRATPALRAYRTSARLHEGCVKTTNALRCRRR